MMDWRTNSSIGTRSCEFSRLLPVQRLSMTLCGILTCTSCIGSQERFPTDFGKSLGSSASTSHLLPNKTIVLGTNENKIMAYVIRLFTSASGSEKINARNDPCILCISTDLIQRGQKQALHRKWQIRVMASTVLLERSICGHCISNQVRACSKW